MKFVVKKVYNVLDTLVLCRNGTERRCDDGLVKGDEEDGQAERENDESEFGGSRILGLLLGNSFVDVVVGIGLCIVCWLYNV